MTFFTLLKQLVKAELQDLEVLKNLFRSVQSVPAHLLAKSKIRLKAERSHFWLKSFK